MKLINWKSASGKTKYFGVEYPDGYILQCTSKKKALAHIEYIKTNEQYCESPELQSEPEYDDRQPVEQTNVTAVPTRETIEDDEVRVGDKRRLANQKVEEAARKFLKSEQETTRSSEEAIRRSEEAARGLEELLDVVSELGRVNTRRHTIEASLCNSSTRAPRQLEQQTIDVEAHE